MVAGPGREELRDFLNGIDLENKSWKDTIESYVCEHWNPKKRTPLFSVGEEDDDSEDSVNTFTETRDIGVQCKWDEKDEEEPIVPGDRRFDDIKRSWDRCEKVTPGEAVRLLRQGEAKQRDLESRFDNNQAISVRRAFIKKPFTNVPYQHYDYKYVVNSCCENVIGYIPVPVGIAGPLLINGESDVYVPMATTEGALIASTNRGMAAIKASKGLQSSVYNCGMSRAPVVKFPTVMEAIRFKNWIEHENSYQLVRNEFESCSRFARLKSLEVTLDGNLVFLRFVAFTGDAMGMNMISKSCSQAMRWISNKFPDMCVLSLSGNYCVDKKPAAINWIQGRGRSVVAECVLPAAVVTRVLKTTPTDVANMANAKLQIGSARAACIGGSNAHSANIVAAIFIATGQDAAQVVSSSMCSTRMEVTPEGNLYVSCTLPCVEVGTVGGGTILPPQKSCLESLNCAGPNFEQPGRNAERLAEIIAATVLAGELSLMAALVTNDLVSSHMKLNRSKLQLYGPEGNSKSRIDRDIEKAGEMAAGGKGNIKLKRIPQEVVQCSNIL